MKFELFEAYSADSTLCVVSNVARQLVVKQLMNKSVIVMHD